MLRLIVILMNSVAVSVSASVLPVQLLSVLTLLLPMNPFLPLTYLFISHNLAVIRYMSDYVAVMHLGRIVESGTREAIFNNPCHPYTKLLMASILDPYADRTRSIDMKVKETIYHRAGCRFCGRCAEAEGACQNEKEPELIRLTDDHFVACHKFSALQEYKR
jgi:oligopeptide/dipeptide ABC transporter ATP-binding protein